MLKNGRSAIALCVAVLILSGAEHADAIISRLRETRLDATDDGITTINELDSQTPAERLYRFGIGGVQFLRSDSPCRSGILGILGGCAPQLAYLTSTFGVIGAGRLFGPNLTPNKLSRSFLKGMPLPPSGLCCKAADTFQSNFCACQDDVILAFRNMGFFDPLQTLDFANFLYGEQCGAVTFLAEDCPNGNPFTTLGGRRMF